MSAALAIAEPAHPRVAGLTGGAVTAIIPQTFDDVYRFSQVLARSGLCPYGMDTPEKVSVAILTGLEIGVKPMQAVQGIAVIGGRPCIWGDLALGIVRSSGLLEKFSEWYEGAPPDWSAAKPTGEGLSYKAFCRVKRVGEEEVISEFSVDDAVVGKLWHKRNKSGSDTPWITNPKRMLKMRARGFALRDTFADVLKGMMVAEEMIGAEDDGESIVTVKRSGPPPAPALPPTPNPPVPEKAEPAAVVAAEEAEVAEVVSAAPRETASATDNPDLDIDTSAPTMDELLSDLRDRMSFAKTEVEVEEAYTDFDAEAELSPFPGGVEAARAAKEEALTRVAPADPFAIPASFADADAYAAWLRAAIAATTAADCDRLTSAWNDSKTQRSNIVMKRSMLVGLREEVAAKLAEFEPQSEDSSAPAGRQDESSVHEARQESESSAGQDAPEGSAAATPLTWEAYEAEGRRVLAEQGGVKAWSWWESTADRRDEIEAIPHAPKVALKKAIVEARKAESGEA